MLTDFYDSRASTITGEKAEKRQERVWKSLVETLNKDVSGIDDFLR